MIIKSVACQVNILLRLLSRWRPFALVFLCCTNLFLQNSDRSLMINLQKYDSFRKEKHFKCNSSQIVISIWICCTHTHTQGLFKGLSLSQLLTTCIVLIFMKRSSRRRPRRQLAAQLFAQSKEKGKKIKEEGGGAKKRSINLPHSALSGRGRPIQSACESHQSHHSRAARKAFAIVKSRESF